MKTSTWGSSHANVPMIPLSVDIPIKGPDEKRATKENQQRRTDKIWCCKKRYKREYHRRFRMVIKTVELLENNWIEESTGCVSKYYTNSAEFQNFYNNERK